MSLARETEPLVVVTADDVAQRVGPPHALAAARRAAAAQLDVATRTGRLTLPLPGGWMRLLGAVVPSLGVFGYKAFHLSPQASVRYAVHLFAVEDGRPLGVVDGALLTPLRTAGAAAAAAVAYLDGGPAPVDVGVIGSSTEAEAGLRALASALPVGKVRVASRSEEHRRRFAMRMAAELDLDVEPVSDAAALSSHSHVVYVGTASGGSVVVDAADLGTAPLVLSIGSTLPVQRELAADVFTGAALVVVDTADALEESGDVIAAREAGFDASRVVPLGRFLEATPVHRPARTVYKSVGSPEQDVVLAAAVLDSAREHGFGRRTDCLSAVKWNL